MTVETRELYFYQVTAGAQDFDNSQFSLETRFFEIMGSGPGNPIPTPKTYANESRFFEIMATNSPGLITAPMISCYTISTPFSNSGMTVMHGDIRLFVVEGGIGGAGRVSGVGLKFFEITTN